jgi:hypothetical protein
MSSPVQTDFDDNEPHPTRWARDPYPDPSAAVMAAADRLKRQRERAPRPPSDIETAMTQLVRENWTPPALDPVVMEPPPMGSSLRPSWGMIARVFGAVGCAAGVALFVAGGVPLSSVDTSANSDRQQQGDMRPVAYTPSDQSASQNPMQGTQNPMQSTVKASTTPSEQRIVSPAPAFSSNAVIGVAVASPTQPSPRELPQAVNVPAAPAASAPLEQAPAPAPALRALERALDRDEIANLLRRGQDLATQGDLAGARLLLRRAAEAGDAQSMQALGATYDSTVLARLKVIGVAPDDARARAWYQRAAAAGAPDATRRLEQLAGRAQQ